MAEPRKATVTIASGATTSGVLNLEDQAARRVFTLTIFAPGALTGVVTVQVAEDPGGTFVALQSGGADVTLPAAKATVITTLIAGSLRLVSTLAEGAQRDFLVRAGALA